VVAEVEVILVPVAAVEVGAPQYVRITSVEIALMEVAANFPTVGNEVVASSSRGRIGRRAILRMKSAVIINEGSAATVAAADSATDLAGAPNALVSRGLARRREVCMSFD